MMVKELLSANTFTAILESTREECKCTYMEAVLLICEKRGLDIETIPDLLTPKTKKLIKEEASELNMLKRKKQ